MHRWKALSKCIVFDWEIPLLEIYPKEIIGQVQEVVCIRRIFITENGEKLDQPKYPPTANWLNKL